MPLVHKKRVIRFKATDLEKERRYMWRDESTPLLLKYLEIHPGQTIVDVGCGTGFFTRLVARGLRGKGRALGIDPDRRLVKTAAQIAKAEGVADYVSFRFGTGESLPVDDQFADRVVCQTVLWVMRDPRPTIKEMLRVCKRGGLLGAVEGAWDHLILHFPADSSLTELQRKYAAARAKGVSKLYGSDWGRAYKLASTFDAIGLDRVRIDGYPYIWYEADDRIPLEYKLEYHRDEVNKFEGKESKEMQEEKILLTEGGMAEEDLNELRRRGYERSRRLLDNPELIASDYSLQSGILFITTGVKR